MTKHANLLITVQRSLLKAHFSDLKFQDTDLDNAIQKFKKTNKSVYRNNNASTLLIVLMKKKILNPHNAVNQTIETSANDFDESSLSGMDEIEESDNNTVESVILDLANIKNLSYIVDKGRPQSKDAK
ncbi:12605_t:CDS:2, partial [Cetraspora pellucida]